MVNIPNKLMYNPQNGLNLTGGSYLRNVQDKRKLSKKKYQNLANNLGNDVFNLYTIKPLALYDVHDFENSEYLQNPDNNYVLLPANVIANQWVDVCKWWNDFLKKSRFRLTVASIGAQVPLNYISPENFAKDLCDEVKKFVYEIADRSISIGVRGEYTGDVLKALGIKNVDVIGCPSWFVNGINQVDVVKKDWSYDFKVSCFSSGSWLKGKQYLIKEALKYTDPKFIIQQEYDIIPYYFLNNDIYIYIRRYFRNLDYFRAAKILKDEYGISMKDQFFNSKVRKLFEFFLDVDEWSRFAKTRDLAFGTRIHGAIVHLKQGVPTLLFVHDMRLLEIAEFFKIPYIRWDKIDITKLDIRELYEKTDFSEMNKAYLPLYENYKAFIHKNGINFVDDTLATQENSGV